MHDSVLVKFFKTTSQAKCELFYFRKRKLSFTFVDSCVQLSGTEQLKDHVKWVLGLKYSL